MLLRERLDNRLLKMKENISARRTKRKESKNIDEPIVVDRYDVELETGLSSEQVAERIEQKATNKIKDSTDKTYFQIIANNLFTFYNMLMIGIAIALVLCIGPKIILNLLFVVILAFNLVIGTTQEIKSKKAIRKLKLMTESRITVIRNSEQIQINQDEIVLDDIVVLHTGDQIPADCVVKSNDLFEVNESMLTGESRPVKKNQGDVLYGGSFVSSGSCVALVNKVGKDTYIHSLENKAKAFKKPKSKLLTNINTIIKILASIAIPLAIVVFWNELIHDPSSFENAVLYGGTTITYMIPAGLILITSIAMETGVMNLAKKKTLMNDLYSVEALSRVDTLCLDKTGTITDGTMILDEIKQIDLSANLDYIMEHYLGAFNDNNQTSIALIDKFGKTVPNNIEKIEFSSDRKFSAVKFESGDIYALGAPEYLCDDANILENAKNCAEHGLRVVLFVKTTKLDEEIIQSKKNHPIAMFMIRDNLRTHIKETMQWFKENDVDIKVISGDNMLTVSYIAKVAGIDNWDKCVDMTTVSDDELPNIVMNTTVFGRTTPEQKSKIIDILKENKRTVAMTGDGINDIGSLKKADCSIALANGAPATKNVANVVLLDSDFNNMTETVIEGRRIVNNIQRTASLFIMKDICWFFITLLPILAGTPHLIEPTVMTITNVIVAGICSFLLALEPNSTRIQGNFTKNVLGRAISAGFFMFLPVLFVYIYSFCVCGLDIGIVANYITTSMIPVISLCVTISGIVIFYNLCQPFTVYRRRLFIAACIVIGFLLTAIPELFLINGTDYMNMMLSSCSTLGEAIHTFWNSLFTFNIYKEFGLAHILITGIFLVISFALYYITDKIIIRTLDLTVFSKKPLIDIEDK